jgi:hypothetical protein
MTVYFKVPSDIQIINRLLHVLRVGNDYKYEASKGLISISSQNITREELNQLAKSIRSSHQTQIEECGPISLGPLNVENKIKTKYNNTPITYKITRTIIDHEKGIITSYANISSRNIDDVVADILSKHIIDDSNSEEAISLDSIPQPMRDVAKTLGISERELLEAAEALNEIFELLDPTK